MAALQVNEIFAIPDYTTVQSLPAGPWFFTITWAANNVAKAFDRTAALHVTQAVTIKCVDGQPLNGNQVHIGMNGSHPFPASVAPGLNNAVRVTGARPGGPAILESANLTVSADRQSFLAVGFRLISNAPFVLPFTHRGAWTWTIHYTPPTGAVQFTDPTQTPIDFYFLQGDPSLRLNAQYYRPLLELAIPTWAELQARPGHEEPQAWFCRRTIERIWRTGGPANGAIPRLQYDNLNGAAHYVAGKHGGQFRIADWFNRRRPMCNCYDLAAIVQTCLLTLGVQHVNTSAGPSEIPLLPSWWTFRKPYGFVRIGPLFGWDYAPYRSGNSPFWANHLGDQPFVHGPTRTHFNNHAWIEVKLPGGAGDRELDACHGTVDSQNLTVLEVGQHNKKEYYRAAIDGDPTLALGPYQESQIGGVVGMNFNVT